MIGNKYLRDLFEYPDEDTSINQLLELLKSKEISFLNSLYTTVDIEGLNDREVNYLTKISALIDYYMQLNCMEVPQWLRNPRLSFEKPYFHPKRITDFEKIKLQYTNPAPFKARNVYFDLYGIGRI